MSRFTRSDKFMVVNYSSLEEATLAEKTFASSNGYCLVIKRTNYIGNKPGDLVKSRSLSYVQYGKPNSNTHSRNTSSLRLECPFTLKISRDNTEGTTWSSIITNNAHNHEATENVAAYTISRALTETEKNTVHSLSSIGAAPRIVLNALRQQNAENNSTVRDMHNIRASKKKKMLDGKIPVEALLDRLISSNIQHVFSRDNEGNLLSLFIIPRFAEIIVEKFSGNKVFLLDSTYKTNKYQMPLLHEIGVAVTNQTFTLFFCFLRSEVEESYTWAMNELRKFVTRCHIDMANSVFVTDREIALKNAINATFPNSNHMLCIWHINKNLFAKQRSAFYSVDTWDNFMRLWQALVNSPSITEYNERLNQLSEGVSESVNAYLLRTWLCFKECFVLVTKPKAVM